VTQEESHLTGRNKIQEMIKKIYLQDYGKDIDLIPLEEEVKDKIEDDHVKHMKSTMPAHRKTMTDLNKDYFEKIIDKEEVWDKKFEFDKKNLEDFEDPVK
jgi:hypothetical protein